MSEITAELDAACELKAVLLQNLLTSAPPMHRQ